MENLIIDTLEYSKENEALLAKYFGLLDKSFEPQLSSYVDIDSYATKLINNALVKVLYDKLTHDFIGLYAVYINDTKTSIAYCSSFAVLDRYKGKGYSKLLMEDCIRVCQDNSMNELKLEVKSSYERAYNFYKKFGFTKQSSKTENSFYMSKIL